MTRKDYAAIARVLSTSTRHRLSVTEYNFLVVSMGNMLASENPRFDHDKWHDACDTEYRENTLAYEHANGGE